MSKFPILRAKEIIKFLKTKGFEVDRQTGSHIVFKKNNRVVVVPFHQGKSLGIGITVAILKDAGFSKKDYSENKKGG
jgi:predicted RNA binding protein YcfA (HicA-like mRNA interferase family)